MIEMKTLEQQIKRGENLWIPDERALRFGLTPPTVDLYIEWMSRADLSPTVPLSIRQYFSGAKNTFIYSFYDYGMSMPAQLYAFSILERAVKSRLKDFKIVYENASGLGAVLRLAKENGFFSLKSFDGKEDMYNQFHSYSHFWVEHGGIFFSYRERIFLEKSYVYTEKFKRKMNGLIAKLFKLFYIRGKVNEIAHLLIAAIANFARSFIRKVEKIDRNLQKRSHVRSFPVFKGKRNYLAHGEELMDLPWEGFHTILLCAEAINSMYHPATEKKFI